MNTLLNELHAYHHDMANKISQIRKLLKKLKHEPDATDDCKLLFEMLEALHSNAERHHHENEEIIRRALLATEAPIHPRILDIERDHQAFARIAGQLKTLAATTKDTKVMLTLSMTISKNITTTWSRRKTYSFQLQTNGFQTVNGWK